MKKQQMIEGFKKQKKDLKETQFLMSFVLGAVGVGFLLYMLFKIPEASKETYTGEEIILVPLFLIAYLALIGIFFYAAWASYHEYAEKISKNERMAAIVENKKEEELVKEWKNKTNVPLIKIQGNAYILPGQENYEKIRTTKTYFTEAEALKKSYLPWNESKEKSIVQLSEKEKLVQELDREKEKNSYSDTLIHFVIASAVVLAGMKVLFPVWNVYVIVLQVLIVLSMFFLLMMEVRKARGRIEKIKKNANQKTEEQLTKKRVDLNGKPLIKADGSCYITQDQIGYEQFKGATYYHTEREALLALRLQVEEGD